MRFTPTLSALAALSFAMPAMAVTLVESDFDTTTVQTYADTATINSGGTTTDDFVVATPTAGQTVAVVNQSVGDNALAFTDNSNATDGPRTNTTFAATSSGTIYGQIDVTPLAVRDGETRSNLAIQITDGGNIPASVLDLNLLPTAAITVIGGNGTEVGTNGWEGAGPQTNVITMTLGETYRISFEIDLSATRDNGTITITSLDDPSDTATTTWNTRLIDGEVDNLRLNNGANPGASSQDASHLVDNIIIQTTPIPEPASLILLGLGGLCLLGRKR